MLLPALIAAVVSGIALRLLGRAGGLPFDRPNARSLHRDIVPRGGGLAKIVQRPLAELIRIEHWDVALNHGAYVGRTWAGKEDAPYTVVPYFFSDLGDWTWFEYVGPGKGRVDIRGSMESDDFVAYYLDEHRRYERYEPLPWTATIAGQSCDSATGSGCGDRRRRRGDPRRGSRPRRSSR